MSEARKELRVTMPDGSVWAVPAQVVAENRARFYADEQPTSAPDHGYAEELAYTLSDNVELIDWAETNMNWDDVKDHARQAEEPDPVDYQEGWVNGEKEVVEIMDWDAWRQKAAKARAHAGRIQQVTDKGIVTRYVPRLAGRNVQVSGELMMYETRREAVEAARRVRQALTTTTEER